MQASKSLRKPTNWQDFETLCKKLWGEVWKCNEIKKNGRSGQKQSGVDVYGIPYWETDYYGIQCKGKDEYSNNVLTESEILCEIEKAKGFIPSLKKLYFATTSNKDVAIEETVREINVRHLKQGLFEVHIFCWEDIVDLIDENRNTHDWYVNYQGFKADRRIEVTFDGTNKEIELNPKFRQLTTIYRMPHFHEYPVNAPFLKPYMKEEVLCYTAEEGGKENPPTVTENFSYVPLSLRIKNIGSEALDDFKVQILLNGDVQELAYTNVVEGDENIKDKEVDFRIINCCELQVIPFQRSLVGGDVYQTNNFYIKPFPEQCQVVLVWNLISRNQKQNGELILSINPTITEVGKEVIVFDKSNVGLDISEVKDVFGTNFDYYK